MWYCGSDYEAGGDYYAQGIGEAYSHDGLTWTKFPDPVFHRDDGVSWRTKRTYTPCVIFENGQYKMWFTGKSDSNYSIGYAEAETEPNFSPNQPQKPIGRASGKMGKLYEYKFKTTDPDGDALYYKIDWGDGTLSDWEGPVTGGKPFRCSHQWDSADVYYLRVKAKDTKGAESDWSHAKRLRIK